MMLGLNKMGIMTTLTDVKHSLERLLAVDGDTVNAADAEAELKLCEGILRRENAFKRVEPGEPLPRKPYELVQARDSVERALQSISMKDISGAMQEVREALEKLSRISQT
jgi:hypothetical protein